LRVESSEFRGRTCSVVRERTGSVQRAQAAGAASSGCAKPSQMISHGTTPSRAFAEKVEGKRLPVSPLSGLFKGCKGHKRIVSKLVVQIKSGKRENGKSFPFNLYRERSTSHKSWYCTIFHDTTPSPRKVYCQLGRQGLGPRAPLQGYLGFKKQRLGRRRR
jgi:hypothetical protein